MEHLARQPGADTGESWVPERAEATPKQTGPQGNPPTDHGSFFQPPGSTPGRRVKPWQIAGALGLVFVPLLVWFAASLTDRGPAPMPVGEPGASASPSEPATTRVTPSSPTSSATSGGDPVLGPLTTASPTDPPTGIPSLPPATTVPSLPSLPNLPTGRGATPSNKPVLTAPPRLLPAPMVSITAIPPGAKTIRFEAQAAGGEKVEVSLADGSHQPFDYPPQKTPLAFEVPVGATLSSSDYYSLRVRTSYDSNATRRPDVACRILVDGVVVTSQQGQGYVTCYISPYYDVRRT